MTGASELIANRKHQVFPFSLLMNIISPHEGRVKIRKKCGKKIKKNNQELSAEEFGDKKLGLLSDGIQYLDLAAVSLVPNQQISFAAG